MNEPAPDRSDPEGSSTRLEHRVARERKARLEAEAIAERSLRSLYVNQERLRLIQRVAAAANDDTDLDTTLRNALDYVCEHTGWPLGHVYMVEAESSTRLVSADLWHLESPDDFAPFREATEQTAFDSGDGLPGRVLATGRPAWVTDVTADPDFTRGAAELGVRGAFAFPVVVGHEVVAVLEFFSVRAEEPDEALLDAMANVGAQLGRAVERDRARRALEDFAAKLQQSNAELEHFASVASHDLQEPLRMVTSFLQLLQRRYADKLDDTADEYIAYAVDGASRMQVLIQNLLTYSRVGTRTVSFERVEAGEIMRKVQEDLSVSLRERNGSLVVDELPAVVADPVQLGQVFQNLIGNGLKFHGSAPPVVRVFAEPTKHVLDDGRSPEGWRFGIADEGIGIAPEHAERIFTIFQRLHSRDEYEGTGIGLAMCKKIVERHGGRIWFESEPDTGNGTTFYFTLPSRPTSTQNHPADG